MVTAPTVLTGASAGKALPIGVGATSAVLRTSYTGRVSTVEQPEEPSVRFYPPDEAIKRARPLPAREDLIIEGVTDEEWSAFQEALAEP